MREGIPYRDRSIDEIDIISVVENKPHLGLTRNESLWPVFQIHHQRSRYIYELYYKRKTISKEVYDYCVQQGYADAALIAKWKKVFIN